MRVILTYVHVATVGQGAGVFTSITNTSITQPPPVSRDATLSIALSDFTNDGWLDAVMCKVAASEFHVNTGTANFVLITGTSFSEVRSLQTQGCAFGDIDNDGWIDIIFANWDGPNELHRNTGETSFELVVNSGSLSAVHLHQPWFYTNYPGNPYGAYAISRAIAVGGNSTCFRSCAGPYYLMLSQPLTSEVRFARGQTMTMMAT